MTKFELETFDRLFKTMGDMATEIYARALGERDTLKSQANVLEARVDDQNLEIVRLRAAVDHHEAKAARFQEALEDVVCVVHVNEDGSMCEADPATVYERLERAGFGMLSEDLKVARAIIDELHQEGATK